MDSVNPLYAWNDWSAELAQRIGEILSVTVELSEITRTQDPALGDLSYVCFRAAKTAGKNPAELAQTIAQALKGKLSWAEDITATGPYVNVRLSTSAAVSRIIKDVEGAGGSYARFPVTSTDLVVFEYANPNTHKEVHIGHLRNFTIGAAVLRVMRTAGRSVIPVSYVNDVGTNVGKCLWHLVRTHGYVIKELTEAQVEALVNAVPVEQRTGKYLGQLYTEATTLAEDEANTPDISFVQSQLEAHNAAWERLWKITRDWCIDELHRIFGELSVEVERQYFESTYLDESGRLVDDLLKRGIAKESQGAVIVDMEEMKLGVLVMRKSDGTLLYAGKDLALMEQKLKDYPQASVLQMVVDVRQAPYFRQLNEVMKRRNFPVPIDSFGYELVRLPEGAMSSRKGTIVTYQSLRDAVVQYATGEIATRHPDWTEGKISQTAWQLAQAGMMFSMLKQDNDKTIVFDMKEALSFDGATGPYCQYAVIRLSSILRKAATRNLFPSKDVPPAFAHASEKQLALSLAAFPQVVATAGRDQRPALVAHWCVETAQNINAFYRDVPVLDATPAEAASRLRLAEAAKTGLSAGLALLGIQIPEEM